MENSKLIGLLKTFTPADWRRFKDFIRSPYFNKNEELVRFSQLLRQASPDFPTKKIERSYVFKKLYPKKTYDDKQMNYLMSFLLKLAEEFIGLRYYEEEGNLPEFHVLSACIDRKLDKHYQFIQKRMNQKLNANPYRNNDFNNQRFLLAEAASNYFMGQMARRHDDSLQNASDYFDQYYLANKLRYCCEMLNRNKLISTNYELRFLEEIRAFLLANPPENPPILMYFTILQMMTAEAPEPFFYQLKSLLSEHQDKFPKTELLEFYQFALNFCIRKINENHSIFLEESLELYMQGIENGLFFTNGYLSPWGYKNVIGASLRLRRFEFAESFIIKYTPYLTEAYRQDALHYNLADLNFYKKAYAKAQEHLNQVEFSDIYINLDSKKLLLKIYFESDEEEALLSMLASFQMFLKRNKLLSAKVKHHYLNFHKILYQLAKRDPSQYAKIQRQLDGMDSVADRRWLQFKLEA